jgi:hypothetical protein
MRLLLYPRFSATDRLQVWLGCTECNQAPALTWRLDGQPLDPQRVTELKPIGPVRPASLTPDANERRFYAGLYEITGVAPDAIHEVEVQAFGLAEDCIARSLPEKIPEEGFHILLVSCFHKTEANAGGIRSVVAAVRQRCRLSRLGRRPDLSFLMGDQVYLDLPTAQNFPNDDLWLAANFEEKYRVNWLGGGGFNAVLEAAPAVCSPDDHEFWNNYPHRSPIIQNSYTLLGRMNWRRGALATYRGFQEPHRSHPRTHVQFDVPPVSFFLADTRSERTNNTFMDPPTLDALRQWGKHLDEKEYVGVFVSGQSLFAEPASAIVGSAMDWELPNYDDFNEVIRALVFGRQPLVCLTGDVHWGRVLRSLPLKPGLRRVHEVIVSPLALVTTVGKDQAAGVFNWLKGWFGRDKPWPRHSDPETTIGPFAEGAAGWRRYEHQIRATLKGDQVGLLSIGWGLNGRLTARFRGWNVGDTSPRTVVDLF